MDTALTPICCARCRQIASIPAADFRSIALIGLCSDGWGLPLDFTNLESPVCPACAEPAEHAAAGIFLRAAHRAIIAEFGATG